MPVYGIRDVNTGEWLSHYSDPVKWKASRCGRAVFTVRERAKDVRDCWRYRGRAAIIVVLKPLCCGRYS